MSVKGSSTGSLVTMFTLLFGHYGDPHWWPGRTPFEVCIGAILTQNTSWSNVETAISVMRESGLLDPFALLSVPQDDLTRAIRPAGYFNQKALYLRSFSSYLVERYGGDIASMAMVPTLQLRVELLNLKGVGEETADSIICYALNKPVLVIDGYTHRVLERFFGPLWGLKGPGSKGSYGSVQDHLMGRLQGDALFYNRFHALIVLLAKDLCKRRPLCSDCPLRGFCNTGSRLSSCPRFETIVKT